MRSSGLLLVILSFLYWAVGPRNSCRRWWGVSPERWAELGISPARTVGRCELSVCCLRACPSSTGRSAVCSSCSSLLEFRPGEGDRDSSPSARVAGAQASDRSSAPESSRSRRAGSAEPGSPASQAVIPRPAGHAGALASPADPPPLELLIKGTGPAALASQSRRLVLRLAAENPTWGTSASTASCSGSASRCRPAASGTFCTERVSSRRRDERA
jgi:hypothetical protein